MPRHPLLTQLPGPSSTTTPVRCTHWGKPRARPSLYLLYQACRQRQGPSSSPKFEPLILLTPRGPNPCGQRIVGWRMVGNWLGWNGWRRWNPRWLNINDGCFFIQDTATRRAPKTNQTSVPLAPTWERGPGVRGRPHGRIFASVPRPSSKTQFGLTFRAIPCAGHPRCIYSVCDRL